MNSYPRIIFSWGYFPLFSWRLLRPDGSLLATAQSNTIDVQFDTFGRHVLEITYTDNLTVHSYSIAVNEASVFFAEII